MKMQGFKRQFRVKRHGFTLAEMLAVVLLISLLAGLGGGIYVGTHRRMLVERAARGHSIRFGEWSKGDMERLARWT